MIRQFFSRFKRKPVVAKSRPQLVEMSAVDRHTIRATYDAARDSDEYRNIWANSDRLDADSSNSRGVRSKLVANSRYEVANNGFADGITQTYATDLIRKGPSLRLKTDNKPFNKIVETAFSKWAKADKLRRKLWCMAHAKVQDGEAFAILRHNPRQNHPVKLTLSLFETEQCQSPQLPHGQPGYVDGIKFDEFGNPQWYEVLKYHPGGQYAHQIDLEPERVPARFMLHWFLLRRPGQNRAVPEFRSTLNSGAASRRWREATIGAAETAADFAAILTSTLPANSDASPDPVAPMSTLSLQKRMVTAAPLGWDVKQMKSEHPHASHESFHKTLISEQARPKSMPFNKAACDSSGHNYASGKLDHQTYHGVIDNDRQDGDDLVLDPLFAVWWEEACYVYGWADEYGVDPLDAPDHAFDWTKHPVADVKSEADANDKRLRSGAVSLRRIYADSGEDFEDVLPDMAADYGKTVEEMREILCTAIFNSQQQQASMTSAESQGAASE